MIHLNAEQQQAASFRNGIASVIAVPGSGKTLTMTHRIGNLVKSGVNPESILGLTFTRNAAAAMKKTLRNVLKEAGGNYSPSFFCQAFRCRIML
jgi:DNA helicase-2/ATP-dependent DNA helicase PcrA